MAQRIEEQIEIMKAYADGKPVYRRGSWREIGELLTEKNHQFDFEHAVYSLTPLDWCTGKEAIDAYESFMRHGSENDPAVATYSVSTSAVNPRTNKKNEFIHSCVDVWNTFSIFIAGAEWVIKNMERGINYTDSLNSFREKYHKIQDEKRDEERRVLRGD